MAPERVDRKRTFDSGAEGREEEDLWPHTMR